MDYKLELVAIPVSDVDRAKAFYSMLGWRLDADVSGDEYRLVQFTPPGSACSILSTRMNPEVRYCSAYIIDGIKDVPPTAGALAWLAASRAQAEKRGSAPATPAWSATRYRRSAGC